MAHRLRDAGALLRSRRAPLPRARRGRGRPDGATARSVSTCPHPARPRHGGHRRAAARPGTAPLAVAAGTAEPWRAGRLHPLQHVQFVPVQAPGEKRRRGLRHSRGNDASECHAVDRRPGPASGDQRGRHTRRGGGDSPGRPGRSRRGAAGRGVMRRGQLGRVVAALGHGRAPGWTGQLVRPGRPPLHGAPGDDDAGVSPVPRQRHRVPEDGGHQRLLSPRARPPLPAGTNPVTRAHARRDGTGGGRHDGPRHPALGLRLVGRPRRGLAGHVRGPAASGQPCDRGA